jgi:hypothetical protein
VQEEAHAPALDRILRQCGEWFHAIELNGTRSWKENRDTVLLAERHGRPVISGGDRHGCEPAACINLTNADTFREFAAEIRSGTSNVLFMPQYCEPMPARILQAARDILRPYPEYPDRVNWTDRIYYAGKDGIDWPLSIIWIGRTPPPLDGARRLIEFAATSGLPSALRWIATDEAELLNE